MEVCSVIFHHAASHDVADKNCTSKASNYVMKQSKQRHRQASKQATSACGAQAVRQDVKQEVRQDARQDAGQAQRGVE